MKIKLQGKLLLLYRITKDIQFKSMFTHGINFLKNKYRTKNGRIPIIEITNHCNRRCKGCYIDFNDSKMSKDLFDKIVSKEVSFGSRIIGIAGGEPLSIDNETIILNSINKYRTISFYICTNGYFLPDLSTLSKIFKCSNIMFMISINGREELHDYVMGVGAFLAAMASFDKLRKMQFLYGANITLNKLNIIDFANYEYLYYLVYCKGVKVFHFMRFRGGELSISELRYKIVKSKIQKLLSKLPVFYSFADAGGGSENLLIYREIFYDVFGQLRSYKL